MFGYFITNDNTELENKEYQKVIIWNEWTFAYYPMNKFVNDKIFYEDNEHIVLLDGVIYNNQEIKNKYNVDSWEEAYRKLIQLHQFMDILRGSFSGFVFYKNSGCLMAFTNHSGEKTVYYTLQNNHLYLASHILLLKKELNKNNVKLKGNTEGLKQLLLAGSLLQENTPFEKVYRIPACYMVTIKSGGGNNKTAVS